MAGETTVSLEPAILGPATMRCLVLATLLLLGLAVPSAPAVSDGRITVSPSTHPWASIGRLNVAGYRLRRHCTAALVAPDLVLTAKHCVNALGEGQWADPSAVHFLAGSDRGTFSAHRRAAGYVPIGDEALLIRLSAPVDLPVIPVDDGPSPRVGAALSQAGYSGDRGHVLTVDPACGYLGEWQDGRWQHNCEAVSGDSGSPLLIDRPGGLAIAAIHVGRIGRVGNAEPISADRVRAVR